MGKGLDVDVSAIADSELADKIKAKENILLQAIIRTIDVVATSETRGGEECVCITEKATHAILYHIPKADFDLDDTLFRRNLWDKYGPREN